MLLKQRPFLSDQKLLRVRSYWGSDTTEDESSLWTTGKLFPWWEEETPRSNLEMRKDRPPRLHSSCCVLLPERRQRFFPSRSANNWDVARGQRAVEFHFTNSAYCFSCPKAGAKEEVIKQRPRENRQSPVDLFLEYTKLQRQDPESNIMTQNFWLFISRQNPSKWTQC